MNRAKFAVRSSATALFAISLLLAIFVNRAAANEVMKDRCGKDVAFPSAYDLGPNSAGTTVLSRGNGSSGNWSYAMRQTTDSAGHIRWWCHSTTGNWADPGTWTVDDAGATYACSDDGSDCVLTGSASVNTNDTSGWTAERSRCDNHSKVFRARLGPDRLLEIECLDENTGTAAQRLVGEADPGGQGFGNGKPTDLVLTFSPLQRAPLDAWVGEFVYPRGQHFSDAKVALAISPNRAQNNNSLVALTPNSYGVSLSEKTTNPTSISQNVSILSISPQNETRYTADSFKVDLTVPSKTTVANKTNVSESISHSTLGSPVQPTAGQPRIGSGSGSNSSHPAVSNMSKPSIRVNTTQAAQALVERADAMPVSGDVKLMLYLVRATNGQFSTYAIRYLRRNGERVLSDVMLLPAAEAPH
jgi:hypothetical protein